MGWISWIILGAIAGTLARWIMPAKRDSDGLLITVAVGIAGGLIGGRLGSELLGVSVTGFNLVSLGLAIGGALILLLAHRLIFGKR